MGASSPEERERTIEEVCDRLDEALFGEHGSATKWINPSMRLDYLIQVARDMRGTVLYQRKEVQVLEQMWKDALPPTPTKERS